MKRFIHPPLSPWLIPAVSCSLHLLNPLFKVANYRQKLLGVSLYYFKLTSQKINALVFVFNLLLEHLNHQTFLLHHRQFLLKFSQLLWVFIPDFIVMGFLFSEIRVIGLLSRFVLCLFLKVLAYILVMLHNFLPPRHLLRITLIFVRVPLNLLRKVDNRLRCLSPQLVHSLTLIAIAIQSRMVSSVNLDKFPVLILNILANRLLELPHFLFQFGQLLPLPPDLILKMIVLLLQSQRFLPVELPHIETQYIAIPLHWTQRLPLTMIQMRSKMWSLMSRLVLLFGLDPGLFS